MHQKQLAAQADWFVPPNYTPVMQMPVSQFLQLLRCIRAYASAYITAS
jgi:hypothetical protein